MAGLKGTEGRRAREPGARRRSEEPIDVPGVQDDSETRVSIRTGLLMNEEDAHEGGTPNSPVQHISRIEMAQEITIDLRTSHKRGLKVRLHSLLTAHVIMNAISVFQDVVLPT